MIKKYIDPFFKNNKCFILAYDHGSNKNTAIFKNESSNPKYIFELAKNINATGIILNKGLAEIYRENKYTTPLIIKLDAKSENTQKPILICSVNYAQKLGAKAIGYTIYFGSEYESEQLKIFSELAEQAHQSNMGVILWAYVVNSKWEHIYDEQKLSFAVRQAYEIGADLIKISNIDNINIITNLQKIVPNLPIAIRGGDNIDENNLLEKSKLLINQGINGFIIGRNIWQKNNAHDIGKKLLKIILNKD